MMASAMHKLTDGETSALLVFHFPVIVSPGVYVVFDVGLIHAMVVVVDLARANKVPGSCGRNSIAKRASRCRIVL